jgi:PAS domain S-box-containing protein
MSSQPTDGAGGNAAGAGLLAAALQTVAQPVWVVDREGLIRFANQAALVALGYSDLRELIGRDSHGTIHHHRPDGRPFPAAECPMLRPRTTGETVSSDLDWFFRRDGSMFPVSYVSAPLEMADGRGAVVAFSDIEARWRTEAALREREAALAEQQAALRRVATLVARGTGSESIFRGVAEEVDALFGSDISAIVRFEGGATVAVMGQRGGPHASGARVAMDPDYVVAAVRRTGRAARFDTDDPAAAGMPAFVREEGIRSGLASPIVVGGELWGAVTIASLDRSLPSGSEQRLADFTELLATAVSSAQAREDLQRLADEQASLRRVATLVAEGSAPAAVFDSVAAEMESLLDADGVTLSRYEPGVEVTIVAHSGAGADKVPAGTRWHHGGENVTSKVRRTERPARIERYAGAQGDIGELVESLGVRIAVGAPIVVEGRLWGVMIAYWSGDEVPSADTEDRMVQFAALLDTAIANADSRDQLTASRARLLTEADEARRRVVRDLHDGAQQRLVQAILTLRLAERALGTGEGDLASLIAQGRELAEQGNAELRELAHGILPEVLTRGGLRAGVETLVARLDLAVEIDIPPDRFPAALEASAYFIVAEALTNVVKHAQAAHAAVRARVTGDSLRVEVRDDGMGGADPDGHGLVGMSDRVTALGGRLELESPPGGGTLVAATLPLSGGS